VASVYTALICSAIAQSWVDGSTSFTAAENISLYAPATSRIAARQP
jgi:hypothetical protein